MSFSKTILSVHQPNYLPWPGYFYKIARSDIFVVLDAVQFPRGRSVANRNLIKTPQGTLRLTIPVKRSGVELCCYNEITVLPGWREKHLKTIELNYRKAPYFSSVYAILNEILQESGNLSEINFRFIDKVVNLLKIKTNIVFLSSYPQFKGMQKSELIVALSKYFSADTYLSGHGGKAYNEEQLFENENIKLEYLDYQAVPYQQLWGSFIPDLSIVDMLFNCGLENSSKLLVEGRDV